MSYFFSVPSELITVFQIAGAIWSRVWWFVLPTLTGILFWQFWLDYVRAEFTKSIKWKLLEIKIPKEILQTPKSMEQVFAAAHAPYSYGLRWSEIYLEGKMESWMSFEMLCTSDSLRFFIRLPAPLKNLMESAVYAHYPEADISEVPAADDYIQKMPKTLPDRTYDIFGASFYLRESNAYPIRTYVDFEDPTEERRVDPIAMLTDIASKLKDDEQLWYQIIIQPAGPEWTAEVKKVVNKLLEREDGGGSKKSGGVSIFSQGLGVSLGDAIMAPFYYPTPTEPKKEEAKQTFKFPNLSPGQQDVLKAIERKASKLAFNATLRFVYIDRKDSFSKENFAAFMGFLRQFYDQNMNIFRPDKSTLPKVATGLFRKKREEVIKRRLYDSYRDTELNSKTMILNAEELATLWHPPSSTVKSPRLQRIESRTGSAPPSLPIL